MHIVYETLHQLEVTDKKILTLFNKQDAITAVSYTHLLDQSLAVVGEEEIDTCYYKAAAQYAAGKKEDAIETYQALINYDKENAQAYFLLGELYRKENDMDKAKENFEKLYDILN